jgi:hypothetical protein
MSGLSDSFVFGEGIDWSSPLRDTYLFVELPFWLMTPTGRVDVQWSGIAFSIEVCSPWTEVFAWEFTDSRASCISQGGSRYEPSEDIAEAIAHAEATAQQQIPLMQRQCKTVLRLKTRAHNDAFRERTDAEPPRAKLEQEAYWASLCDAHLPVVNELIQRYRLVTYDYFAYEVSAWDVPVWYIRPETAGGHRVVLMPYKGWDQKPCVVEGMDSANKPKTRVFEWSPLGDLTAASSQDATPGEFDLLDARSLMERGNYTGAVRRTVTAIEAVLAWALLGELAKKYDSAEAALQLQKTDTDFPGRWRQWRKLANSQTGQGEFDRFQKTRDIRHEIVHRGRRLTHLDRFVAQQAVDTGRWLYSKIEGKPHRAALRTKSDKNPLKSAGRMAMAIRFPAILNADGITLIPLKLPGSPPPHADP